MVPLYGKVLDKGLQLSGVTAAESIPEITKAGLWDGSSQTAVNSYWENNFPGRKLLLKVRNQGMYSIVRTSPNNNVLLGKGAYLYEPQYIYRELKILPPCDSEYFSELSDKLGRFKELLSANGKELYVFITPSKAHFCRDRIAAKHMLLDKTQEYDYSDYSELLKVLDDNDINYFDSVAYIEDHLGNSSIEAPLFYASGIHWSHPWGETCAKELLEMMNKNSKYDLGSVEVTETQVPDPVFPATDLYDSLNLLRKAEDNWYNADTVIAVEGKDKPSIFVRGGSFMGQSTTSLIKAGVFGKDVHYENNYYYTDRYTVSKNLSSFDSYDEAEVDRMVGQSDIVLLEVNTSSIPRMGFGFIDYMLEHPDYCDSEF